MLKIINGVKCYPVNETMKFNLESCHDKYFCMIIDAQKANDTQAIERLENLMKEADELAFKANAAGYLSGPEYSRAKNFMAWRIMQRDIANANARR